MQNSSLKNHVQNPESFDEHIDVAKQGGTIALNARLELEKKTGKDIKSLQAWSIQKNQRVQTRNFNTVINALQNEISLHFNDFSEYAGVSYYYTSHFFEGTTINGIDSSNRTAY